LWLARQAELLTWDFNAGEDRAIEASRVPTESGERQAGAIANPPQAEPGNAQSSPKVLQIVRALLAGVARGVDVILGEELRARPRVLLGEREHLVAVAGPIDRIEPGFAAEHLEGR
jgi:hypothetical protein